MVTHLHTDMLGRVVTIAQPPRRIVSLVPSQTELLSDLGLDKQVVGITKFCIHPDDWYRSKKRVGGTKKIHLDIIRELDPDLIIANKEENTREDIELLAAHYPVWVSDIQDLDDALQMIRNIGALTDRELQAQAFTNEISDGFSYFKKNDPLRVAYFIWREPWMSAGRDTFIHDIIERIGWENVMSDRLRYPVVELQSLKSMHIDRVLLSSEPYPFKQKHIGEIKAVLPEADVQLVNGEMFSWYGSRLRKALPYLQQLVVPV